MHLYTCLACDSDHGQKSDDPLLEDWFWIKAEPRIGPFCSKTCLTAVQQNGVGRTRWLREWRRQRLIESSEDEEPAYAFSFSMLVQANAGDKSAWNTPGVWIWDQAKNRVTLTRKEFGHVICPPAD